MGARIGILLLVAAALAFLVAANIHEIAPALLSFFLGGAGLATLITAAVRNRQITPPDSPLLEARFQQLEKRIQTTEDELAATARELAGLRDERDFDRQLYGAARRAVPPAAPDPADPS